MRNFLDAIQNVPQPQPEPVEGRIDLSAALYASAAGPRGETIMNIVRIILAIFLPPVAAFLTVGIGLHFWLNLLLTLFFFVPGMIHALWLVVRNAQGTGSSL